MVITEVNFFAPPNNAEMPYKRGLSTVDLLEPTSLDKLRFVIKTFLTIYKTSYPNEEVNCTKPFPSVSVP
jgi:hypothetical protein